MKYKNKNGMSLNCNGADEYTELMKEVISEGIRLLESDTWSMYIRIQKAVVFLKENFDIEEKNNGEWLRNSKK